MIIGYGYEQDARTSGVGISSSDYTEIYKVTINKNMKNESLISTHKKDTPYWRQPEQTLPGGGEQIYNESIKNAGNATFEKIN